MGRESYICKRLENGDLIEAFQMESDYPMFKGDRIRQTIILKNWNNAITPNFKVSTDGNSEMLGGSCIRVDGELALNIYNLIRLQCLSPVGVHKQQCQDVVLFIELFWGVAAENSAVKYLITKGE